MIIQSLIRIKGIGKKTKSNLLNFFGTIANIQSASLADLKKVEGIGVNTAKKIYNEFNKKCLDSKISRTFNNIKNSSNTKYYFLICIEINIEYISGLH